MRRGGWSLRAAAAPDRHRLGDPLELLAPCLRPRERLVPGALAHRRVGDERARAGALGEARGEVDGAAVVVAPTAQRLAVRRAGVQRRELLALALGRLHQAER